MCNTHDSSNGIVPPWLIGGGFPSPPIFFAGNLREVRSVPPTRFFPSKILAGNPGEPVREGNVVPAQFFTCALTTRLSIARAHDSCSNHAKDGACEGRKEAGVSNERWKIAG